jgi:hypothetical protein
MSLVPFQNFPDGSPQKERHTRKSESESRRKSESESRRKSESESRRKSESESRRKSDETRKSSDSKDKTRKYTTHVSKSGDTFYVTADGVATWEKPVSESESEWGTQISTTTGKPFYFNKKTKETRWTPPETRKKRSPRQDVWEPRTSTTTGQEYFVNRRTGESSWENPTAPPVIEDGYIVKRNFHGNKTYLDPNTGETFNYKPFPKYLPDSVEALRLSAEDRVLNQLGIKSCRQIRIYLESSEMTEAEQVTFIEMHAKDTKELRKLLKSGDFSSDQFRMLGEMGVEAMAKLRSQVTSLIKSTEEEPKDEEEIECVVLRKKVETFYKNNPTISKSHWRRIIDASKSFIAKIYHKLKELGYDAFMAIYNAMPSLDQLRVCIFWFVQKGIDISIWIASNPKTAYYVIQGFIYAKKYMCQAIGHAFNLIELDPNDTAFIQKLRKEYPKALDPNEKEKWSTQLYDMLRPKLENGMIEATSYVSKEAMIATRTFIKTGTTTVVQGTLASTATAATGAATSAATGALTSAVTGTAATIATGATVATGAATGAATVGTTATAGAVAASGGTLLVPLAVVATTAILYTAATAALDYGIEKVEETAEQLSYWNDIRNNYNKLIELADPLPCLKQILVVTEKKAAVDSNLSIKLYMHLGKMIRDQLPDTHTSKDDQDVEGIKITFKNCLHSHHSKKFRDAESRLAEISNLDSNLVPKLAHIAYYSKEDTWIQAAVYMWSQSRVKNLKDTSYGPITNIDLEGEKEKLVTAIKAERYAKDVSKLETWKLQFDKYKVDWDKERFGTDMTDDTIPEEVVAMLTQDISADYYEYVESLGADRKSAVNAALKSYMNLNEYLYKAMAVKYIYDTLKTDATKVLHVRYPPWINACVRSVRETIKLEDKIALKEQGSESVKETLDELQRESRLKAWQGQTPFPYVEIVPKLKELARERKETRTDMVNRDENIQRTRGEFQEFLNKADIHIDAYKKFMGREGSLNDYYPRLMKLVIEPLNYFEREMNKDTHTAGRKKNIKKAAQAVVDRLGSPKSTYATDAALYSVIPKLTHGYVKKCLDDEIKARSRFSNSAPNKNYFLIIAALYLMHNELRIYGTSVILEKIVGETKDVATALDLFRKSGEHALWRDPAVLARIFGKRVPLNTPYQNSRENPKLSFYDYVAQPSAIISKSAYKDALADKAGEEIIGTDYTQMVPTRAFIRFTLIDVGTSYPESLLTPAEKMGLELKSIALNASANFGALVALSITPAPLIMGAAYMIGFDTMVRGVDKAKLMKRNAYYAPYNQDLSIEDQNNNPTVAEIFTFLEFPHPAIHPDHWEKYYKLPEDDFKRRSVNDFARQDASKEGIMDIAYGLIKNILDGVTFPEGDAKYKDLWNTLSKRGRVAVFGGDPASLFDD